MSFPAPASLDFSGRTFSPDDLTLIREVIRDFSSLSLTELSNTLCELLEWKRPNGKLKFEECRALLEHLQASAVISLPALRKTSPFGPRRIAATSQSDPQSPITGSAGQLLPLSLELVQASNASLSSLFRQFIDRYHYLHYRVPFGASLRYLVHSARLPGRYLACLLFSSPAWRMAPRDAWIGWSDPERKRNLQYIVSNGRFLILPWVSVRGLASSILSLAARQLPADWLRLYGYRPLLLESLVDSSRFSGTIYRASNWIRLGQTQGRGRMDRDNVARGRAVKDIYVFPLCRNAQRRLRQAEPPTFIESVEPEALP
jgi:hypothetical protein